MQEMGSKLFLVMPREIRAVDMFLSDAPVSCCRKWGRNGAKLKDLRPGDTFVVLFPQLVGHVQINVLRDLAVHVSQASADRLDWDALLHHDARMCVAHAMRSDVLVDDTGSRLHQVFAVRWVLEVFAFFVKHE